MGRPLPSVDLITPDRELERTWDQAVRDLDALVEQRLQPFEMLYPRLLGVGGGQVNVQLHGKVWGQHQPGVLDEIAKVLCKTPGTCPVYVQIMDAAGKRAVLRAGGGALAESLKGRSNLKVSIDGLEVRLQVPPHSAEILAAIDAAIAETGATGPADMGKLMGVLKPKLAGQADMGLVSALVKKKFAG